jgi:hypothetical protein
VCIATTVARPKWAEALFRSDPDIRVLIATDAAGECEFRFNPAGDSDLIPATIPI